MHFSMSKELMPIIFFRSTLLRSHSMTSAKWLIFLMSFLIALREFVRCH